MSYKPFATCIKTGEVSGKHYWQGSSPCEDASLKVKTGHQPWAHHQGLPAARALNQGSSSGLTSSQGSESGLSPDSEDFQGFVSGG
eukprot:1160580-Pelagomonas_calceolata.AAC.10